MMTMLKKSLLVLSLALAGSIGSAWGQAADPPTSVEKPCELKPAVNAENCYINLVVIAPTGASRCSVMLQDLKAVEILVGKNTGIYMFWKLIDETNLYRFKKTAGVVFSYNYQKNFKGGKRVTNQLYRIHNQGIVAPLPYEYKVNVTGPKNCTLDPWIKNQ